MKEILKIGAIEVSKMDKSINSKDTTPDRTCNFDHIIKSIQTENQEITQNLRNERDDAVRRSMKVNQLHYFIPSGIYEKRNKGSLIKYSNIICLDIDHVDSPEHYKKVLGEKCEYFIFCFVSPSGNGLKIFYLGNGKPKNHDVMYEAYADYLEDLFGKKDLVDRQPKDLARACFLAYDPDLFINPSWEEDENWYPPTLEIDKNVTEDVNTTNYHGPYDSESKSNKNDEKYFDEVAASWCYLDDNGLSITSTHDDWYKLAFAFAETFSFNVGRNYYLKYCQLDGDKHSEENSKKQWKYAWRNNDHRITFSTFRYMVRKQGFEFCTEEGPIDTSYAQHSDEPFLRVGPDWYKIVRVLNAYGFYDEEVLPWKVAEIIRDIGKDNVRNLNKYDLFTNRPDFSTGYTRVHGNLFNISPPLAYIPEDGIITNSGPTQSMLKRMFVGNGEIHKDLHGDMFTMILDYLTILVQYPEHKLPALLLLSKENGTGKTFFLNWLRMLLGNNVVIVGNDQIKSRFNSPYADKLVVAVDEGFLESEKRSEKERMKMMATAVEMFVEAKGKDAVKLESHCKLIFSSNDEERVMHIDKTETRWLAIKVPAIKDEERDNNLMEKLIKEAPIFLHFLLNRRIFHEKKDRMWFDSKLFNNEALRRIIEGTQPRKYKVITEVIMEAFSLDDRNAILYVSNIELTKAVNKIAKYKLEPSDVTEFMKEKGVAKTDPRNQNWPEVDFQSGRIEAITRKGRCWVLEREYWINDVS